MVWGTEEEEIIFDRFPYFYIIISWLTKFASHTLSPFPFRLSKGNFSEYTKNPPRKSENEGYFLVTFIIMINLIDKRGLTDEWKQLLEDVLQDPRKNLQGLLLTQERVGMILSIQDRISPTEDGHWKIAEKRSRGWHLHLEKLKNKFYRSTK